MPGTIRFRSRSRPRPAEMRSFPATGADEGEDLSSRRRAPPDVVLHHGTSRCGSPPRGMPCHNSRPDARTTMEPRQNPFTSQVLGKVLKHIIVAAKELEDSTLPSSTQELVNLRASQINGCGSCTDMHFKDVLQVGESAERLNLVASWREATAFTEAGRGTGADRGGHAHRRCGRWRSGRGLGERGRALRRPPARRAGGRRHPRQRAQPRERRAPEACRRLPARSGRVIGSAVVAPQSEVAQQQTASTAAPRTTTRAGWSGTESSASGTRTSARARDVLSDPRPRRR